MKSARLLFNFTAGQLLEKAKISVLSVYEDTLLVGSKLHVQFYTYHKEGRHLSSLIVNSCNTLWDAVWTTHGNILCTKYNAISKRYRFILVILLKSGNVNYTTLANQLTEPRYRRVTDDVVFNLAYSLPDEFESTDNSVSCALIFKVTNNGSACWQVLKITTGNSDNFWTIERISSQNFRLRVYSVDNRRPDGNVTWRNINATPKDGKRINLVASSLSYDGSMNIFLSDLYNKAIHVYLMNGQYHCQLLSASNLNNKPYKLTVDKKRKLLYVGQDNNLIEVFSLAYEEI